jgi:hypothetical protein
MPNTSIETKDTFEITPSTDESNVTNIDWTSDSSVSNEDFIEEDIIAELNDVSILASSRFSLQQHQNNHSTLIDKKWTDEKTFPPKTSKFKQIRERLPLKGYIYALMCALCNTFSLILLKLSTTLTGMYS